MIRQRGVGVAERTAQKVRGLADLVQIVADLHARGKIVAFTNGAFDLLHVGHIRSIQHARSLGDVLIVGVNSDESVRGGKGPSRPLVPEAERAEVLAALADVDYVTIFAEATATNLVRALRPDVYVKGGDYSEDSLPEAPFVRAYGGRITFVPFVAGRSTTRLAERVRGSGGP
ncbi:MAG: D-glycero-beta-D-manno-heptose 1-phosphate adenylyltransferase [Chloroflexota bacterium]